MSREYLKEFELNANSFTLKAIGLTCIIFGVIWILNMLGVFIVDSSIMHRGFFGCLLINALTFSTCKWLGLGNPKTKYVAMFFAVASYEYICIMLTYHASLIMLFPIILSVQYRTFKFIVYTFILTAVGQIVNVYAGYYFGLCNANMLLFTANSTEYYVQQILAGTLAPNDPGIPRNLALFIFFVVPQWFVQLAFLPVLLHISKQIETRAQREFMFSQKQDFDFMTGTFNRGCLQRLTKEYYVNVKEIAVIVWDIDDLKAINDTRGQDVGDTLVAMTADSIKALSMPDQRVFRFDGDRFIMVIEKPAVGDINRVLLKWNARADQLNMGSSVRISASVGYSEGKGSDLTKLIEDASHMMFSHKATSKMVAV